MTAPKEWLSKSVQIPTLFSKFGTRGKFFQSVFDSNKALAPVGSSMIRHDQRRVASALYEINRAQGDIYPDEPVFGIGHQMYLHHAAKRLTVRIRDH